MTRPIIVAVDFDGTIVEHNFPKIGKAMPRAIEVLQKLKKAGAYLILWTCRTGKEEKEAILWLKSKGVEIDGCNEHSEWAKEEFKEFVERDGLGSKIFADVYIDDRNLGGFPGWDVIEEYFFRGK